MTYDPPRDLVQKRYTVITDLERGDSVETVASYLVNEGWDEQEALNFVTVIRDEQAAGRPVLEEREPTAEEIHDADTYRMAKRNMRIGGFIFTGGAFVTLITFCASDTTGYFWLMPGALIFGGWRFLIGHNTIRRLEKSRMQRIDSEPPRVP